MALKGVLRATRNMLTPTLFLVGILLLTALGPGFQNVPVGSWFQPLLVLIFLTRASSKMKWIGAVVVLTLGNTFAFAGLFNDPHQTFLGLVIVFGASLLISVVALVFVYLVYMRILQRFTHLGSKVVLVFPTLLTGFYIVLNYTPTGDILNLANSQIENSTLVQLTSIFGLGSIIFLIGSFASVSHWLLNDTNKNKKTALTFAFAVLIALCIAGLLSACYQGRFFQVPLEDTAPNNYIKAACIIGMSDKTAISQMLSQSQQLAPSHKLLLWSEAAVQVTGFDEETTLIANVSAIASNFKTYIGATYQIGIPGIPSPNQRNMFVLIDDKGKTAFKYQKAHPVPGAESDVQPGLPQLPYVDTPFGRVGGAICFDFNYPQFIAQAGQHNVDLMLQPSWTWGPIGYYHARINAARAVENGFHTFRCSSYGYSGIFTPNYDTLAFKPMLTNGTMAGLEIPVVKRQWTLYPVIVDLFSWTCLAFGILYTLCAWLPLSVLARIPYFGITLVPPPPATSYEEDDGIDDEADKALV